ncbi:hypothetical protein EXS71_04980 [Candidatus Uhrbacteria bacterium]|nr:hypothetical protein [Candidatus Uhrbacteria bacterium]
MKSLASLLLFYYSPRYYARSHGTYWFELGTVVVIDEYCHKANPSLFIADELYRRMLAAFPHVNILATTTNEKALKS